MKPSLRLLTLGVGAWMILGSVGAAFANPARTQNDSTPSPFNFILTAHRDPDGDPTPPFAIAQATATSKPNPKQLTSKPPTTAQGASAPASSAPLPASAGSPRTPAPVPAATPPSTTPAPTTPTTGGVNQLVPTPDFLNPSPNRLQFPTQPREVQIRATQPITLQQALELAERNNRDLEVARLQVEQSRFGIQLARAGNFPTFGITAGLTQSGSAFISQSSSIPGVSTGGSRLGFSTGAQLNYDIFTSGLRPAQIQVAERQSRASELQLEQTREDLRLQVSNDYYNLQNADSQVAINEAAVRNAEANLRDSRAQEAAGLGTRFDTLRAEVNLANAQQLLRNAQANQQISRRQLAQRLSLSETVTLTAADPVQPAGTWTIPLEDSIVLAYKNRAELEQQLVQREISLAQIQAARAQNGVTLGFVGAYNVQTTGGGTGGFGGGSSDSYSLGLQARLNLFDGGATKAQIAQQERNREIAEARFAQNRNLVRFQVEQAFANLQANLANINTTQQSVAQAEEALRLAILRFQAGVGTQTDRISAEAALTQAQGNRVSAIINYNLALAQLRRAVSNLSP